MRVFMTQMGFENVTAVAPAMTLLERAFNVGDMLGKYLLRKDLEDSYLVSEHKLTTNTQENGFHG